MRCLPGTGSGVGPGLSLEAAVLPLSDHDLGSFSGYQLITRDDEIAAAGSTLGWRLRCRFHDQLCCFLLCRPYYPLTWIVAERIEVHDRSKLTTHQKKIADWIYTGRSSLGSYQTKI